MVQYKNKLLINSPEYWHIKFRKASPTNFSPSSAIVLIKLATDSRPGSSQLFSKKWSIICTYSMQIITYSSVEDIRPGTVHKNYVKNQT